MQLSSYKCDCDYIVVCRFLSEINLLSYTNNLLVSLHTFMYRKYPTLRDIIIILTHYSYYNTNIL